MPKGIRKKEDRWQNIEYWIKRNPEKSVEECEILRQEKLRHSRESKQNNRKYWKKLHPEWSEDEIDNALYQYKSENSPQCIEYWRKKFPDASEIELNEMLKNKKLSSISKRPDNSGENNPRHRSKTTVIERKEASPSSIEYYIKRFPDKTVEECEVLRREHFRKLSRAKNPQNTVTCIEYWVSKGYSEDEARLIISNKFKFTLEKCIEKHGKVEGLRIYTERQQKWLNSVKNSFVSEFGITQSRWAKTIIEKIQQILPEAEQEFIIGKYSFDLKYKNNLIEFNGDYFHCNPKFYDAEFYNKLVKKTANEIWKKDATKIKLAQDSGYNVFILWEFDSVHEEDLGVRKCINFLTNK